MPAAVPGIVFLSGGQSDEDATANLNAINAHGPHPWEISFSYSRALQAERTECIRKGKPENVKAGQRAYRSPRANELCRATLGTYTPEMERETIDA